MSGGHRDYDLVCIGPRATQASIGCRNSELVLYRAQCQRGIYPTSERGGISQGICECKYSCAARVIGFLQPNKGGDCFIHTDVTSEWVYPILFSVSRTTQLAQVVERIDQLKIANSVPCSVRASTSGQV